jgi:5-hydroxyisourate hydrolase
MKAGSTPVDPTETTRRPRPALRAPVGPETVAASCPWGTPMRKKNVPGRRLLLAAGLVLGLLAASPPAGVLAAADEGRLTTHVLDTPNGKPASGMRIDFSVREGDRYRLLKTIRTNADGRADEPLLKGEAMAVGQYRLVFHVAEYFAKAGASLASPPFLDEVPLEFAISDAAAHYHVPLLTSPWSYTTYRGS